MTLLLCQLPGGAPVPDLLRLRPGLQEQLHAALVAVLRRHQQGEGAVLRPDLLRVR